MAKRKAAVIEIVPEANVQVEVAVTPEKRAETVNKLSAQLIAEMTKGKTPAAASLSIPAREVSTKSVAKSTLVLGALTFPVKTYTATDEDKVSFHQCHVAADGTAHRLNQGAMRCNTCDTEIAKSDIVKGYQTDKKEVVVFSEAELDGCQITNDETLEILEFVPADQLDPIYFAASQYLAPGGTKAKETEVAAQAFGLLRLAMIETKTVAIAKRVMRGRDQIVAVRPFQQGMTVHALLFDYELRICNGWEKVPAEMDAAHVRAAVELVNALTTNFDMSAKVDSYNANVRSLVAAKTAGNEVPVFTKAPAPAESVPDIMSVLKASLAKAQRKAS